MKKGLRFEIFRRDNFTCRYCGSQPPDVVLEVDHVVPRVDGGSDDPLNLVTACHGCNRGKGRKRIDIASSAQPDADLEYLAVQQEIAEIERYEHSLAARNEAMTRLCASFQELWCDVGDLDWHPKDRIILSLLARYEPEIVEMAIRDVAPKVGSGYLPSYNDRKWVSYLYAVARNLAEEN